MNKALYTTVEDDDRCSEMETLNLCDLLTASSDGPHCHVTCTCEGRENCKLKLVRGTHLGNEGSLSVCDVQQT